MSEPIPGLQGVLGALVWPTYVGVASDDPGPGPVPEHEPYEDVNYSRGQIWWTAQPDGEIVGSAQVFAPKGVYTWFVFCHGPIRHMMMGATKLDQPIVFDRAGLIDVEPIQNVSYLPRSAALPRRPT